MDVDSWREKYLLKLNNNTRIAANGSCQIWTGYARYRNKVWYGEVKAYISPWQEGRENKVSVHRLAYFLHNPEHIGQPGDCSHRCHNSLCINPAHICLEPHFVNNNRQTCIGTNICLGHATYPACLLEYHLSDQVCMLFCILWRLSYSNVLIHVNYGLFNVTNIVIICMHHYFCLF